MIRAQLSILLVSVIAACGGNNPIAIKDLPQKFNDTDCANEVECDQQPDNTTCEASLGNNSDSESETLIADVGTGKVKYDSGAAQSCLDELSNNPCDFAGIHGTAADCLKIFTGTVADGGACDIDQECVSSACTATDSTCDRQTSCCPGTCSTVPALIALGAACDTSMNACVDTAYCKLTDPTGQTTTTGTCTALISGSGAACDSDVGSCANPQYCNLDFSTGLGTCKSPAASGAACVTTDLLPCVDSRDYCDATMMKCTQKIAVGGACPTNVFCEDLATCSTSSTCVANLGLGATCDATTSGAPTCLGNLSCTNSKCTVPASGPACTM